MIPVTEQEALNSSPDPNGEEEGGSAFSPKEILLFIGNSARQNLGLCLLIATVISLLGSTIVVALPPVYDSTFKIFIQEGGTVTSSLASGRDRYRPIEGARGLEEYLLARDNLLAVVREAKLVDRWPKSRPLPLQVKDRIMAALFGPPARKDMERVFVEMLSTSISGEKEGESVRVHAQWRDGQSAYEIARLVERNFLASRAAHDFGPIQRAISLLEAQLQQADEALEQAIMRAHSGKKHGSEPVAGATPTAPNGKASATNEAAVLELQNLGKQLSATRRQQRSLLEGRRRRVAELTTQAEDMRVSYTAEHPLMQQIQAKIAAANEEPEGLAELRTKETELLSAISSRTASVGDAAGAAAISAATGEAPDPELSPERARVAKALRKSDEVAERLEDARIELTTAEGDFKHRYVVIEEAEVPGKPLKAKKSLLLSLVLVLAIVLGVGAGTGRELLKGRLAEPWQVRALGLPLLGDVVELKKLPPGGQS